MSRYVETQCVATIQPTSQANLAEIKIMVISIELELKMDMGAAVEPTNIVINP